MKGWRKQRTTMIPFLLATLPFVPRLPQLSQPWFRNHVDSFSLYCIESSRRKLNWIWFKRSIVEGSPVRKGRRKRWYRPFLSRLTCLHLHLVSAHVNGGEWYSESFPREILLPYHTQPEPPHRLCSHWLPAMQSCSERANLQTPVCSTAHKNIHKLDVSSFCYFFLRAWNEKMIEY